MGSLHSPQLRPQSLVLLNQQNRKTWRKHATFLGIISKVKELGEIEKAPSIRRIKNITKCRDKLAHSFFVLGWIQMLRISHDIIQYFHPQLELLVVGYSVAPSSRASSVTLQINMMEKHNVSSA